MTLLYFLIYILFINLIGFITMYVDKKKARKGAWRISEKVIFIIAFVLGAIGVYVGIYKFRHKTKHTLFTVGIPIMIILNTICFYYIIKMFYVIYK